MDTGKHCDFYPANPYHIEMPPAFNDMSWGQVEFLCEIAPGTPEQFGPIGPYEALTAGQKRFFHLKAWWAFAGAKDPGLAAAAQTMSEGPIDEEWDRECQSRGWPVWHPKSYSELEAKFLPHPTPSITLIMARCPQMALLHSLGGDVTEPYWWAGLSVTEHAEPNLSRDCSSGYPQFSDAELEYRQRRIKDEGVKPALCQRLDCVNPGVCQHCRFNGIVNSPIALGFENEPRGRK